MIGTLLRNIGMLATCPLEGGQSEVGIILNAAVVWRGAVIEWVGEERAIPTSIGRVQEVDAGGSLVVPGLIDCHTHLAFGGWRSEEFELRILGRPYLEIEAAGGGIASTVRKTRAATHEHLVERCRHHLLDMSRLGVTTVEAKSGYGLTFEDEIKLLEVYRSLDAFSPISVTPTFLGAHTIPPEYRSNRDGYVSCVIEEMLPEVIQRGLARACDVFVESSAFTLDEGRRILGAAKRGGLATTIHADQFSDSGGARLAVEMAARSADHLESAGDEGIAALASSSVVAVMLPLASLYTNQKPADARRFIERGCRVAVATDFNPGSAPSYHLPLAMMLGCTLNRMTPREVLKGVTSYAAEALGLASTVGSLREGFQADLALIDAESVEEWMYHPREGRCRATWKGGALVHGGS